MEDSHKQDHDRIINMLDCSEKVVGIEKEVLLLKEKIKEFKEDKEKAESKNGKYMNWIFALLMAVAGSGINSFSTINVLKEKVQEQKKEIEKLSVYISDQTGWIEQKIDDHVANH